MSSFHASLRRPEYTGVRRCWPCTILNVAMLALACGIALVVSPPFALGLAFVGSGMIWLRGYLVPYTPTLAPRLLERLPGGGTNSPSVEGVERTPGSLATVAGDERVERGESVTTALLDAGVLETDGDGTRLFLADAFAARWKQEMRAVRSFDGDELETAVGCAVGGDVDVEVLDAAEGVEPWIGVTSPGGESWVPHAVGIAEVGAVRTMAALAPGVPADDRVAAAGPLRAFLKSCPVCEGALVETAPTACCGSVRDRQSLPESILACTDCDVRLYSFTTR